MADQTGKFWWTIEAVFVSRSSLNNQFPSQISAYPNVSPNDPPSKKFLVTDTLCSVKNHFADLSMQKKTQRNASKKLASKLTNGLDKEVRHKPGTAINT